MSPRLLASVVIRGRTCWRELELWKDADGAQGGLRLQRRHSPACRLHLGPWIWLNWGELLRLFLPKNLPTSTCTPFRFFLKLRAAANALTKRSAKR